MPYYKYLLQLLGDADFTHHLHPTDQLSESQKHFAQAQLTQFQAWWQSWEGRED